MSTSKTMLNDEEEESDSINGYSSPITSPSTITSKINKMRMGLSLHTIFNKRAKTIPISGSSSMEIITIMSKREITVPRISKSSFILHLAFIGYVLGRSM
jgi:hypothetical protein